MKQRNSKLAAMMLCMGFTVSVPTFTYGMGENALNILQQGQKISGLVVDSNGEPIIGATIKVVEIGRAHV